MKYFTHRGFTLMELMIVIAIIGILVAIAIPSYHIYTRRAHFTEIVQAAAPFKLGVEECFQVNGSLDDCSAGQSDIPPNISSGDGAGLVQTITVTAGGSIAVTPKNEFGISSKDTYILTPTIENNVLIWKTSGGAVSAGYVG